MVKPTGKCLESFVTGACGPNLSGPLGPLCSAHNMATRFGLVPRPLDPESAKLDVKEQID